MKWKTDDEDYQRGLKSMGVDPNLEIWWESILDRFEPGERMIFLVLIVSVTTVGVIGNILTLLVVVARKQRLMFRVCLLSLSLSDLIYIAASGSNNLSKLFRNNLVLWTLGSVGCSLIPFFQTSTLLTGSMSLVAIALDRYLAVLNKSNSKVLQSKVFCFFGFAVIWILSLLVSLPMLFSYKIEEVYIVPDDNHEAFYKAKLCMTEPIESASYFYVIFTFIFLPLFAAFIWLNGVVANEIWKRRHTPVSQIQTKTKTADDDDSSTLEMKNTDDTNTSSNGRNHSGKISSGEMKNSAISSKQTVFTVQTTSQSTAQPNNETHRSERQRRQMRMFKAILVLMLVFICCRLPNWLFLLYKLSFEISGRLNWLLMYSFAAMGILNCMLNPLLYQFLGETIRITSHIGSACYKFCRLCRRTKKTTSHYANNQTMFAKQTQRKSDGGIYLGS